MFLNLLLITILCLGIFNAKSLKRCTQNVVAPVYSGNEAAPLVDSCFYMQSVQNGLVADYGNAKDFTILLRPLNKSPNQVVCVEKGNEWEDFYYVYFKIDKNKVFSILGDEGRTNGANIFKYPIRGGAYQQIGIIRNKLGQFNFKALNSGMFFGVNFAGKITQSQPDGSDSQLWRLIPY